MNTEVHDHVWLNSSKNGKCIKQMLYRQSTHIVCSISYFKQCRIWDNVEICCTAGQATDDNMAHAHCMLDT